MSLFDASAENSKLKVDLLTRWVENAWIPNQPNPEALRIVWLQEEAIHARALSRVEPDFDFGDGYCFTGYTPIECPVVSRAASFDTRGNLTYQTGSFLYHFHNPTTQAATSVLVLATPYSDNGWYRLVMAVTPVDFLPIVAKFDSEIYRLAYAIEPSNEVVMVGGRSETFKPEFDWDDIVLPESLKNEIRDDVESFFSKGVEVYNRLNLKPFRKLLLAGVPGTGKTMICSALAKWALAQNYLVIYISSANKQRDEESGANFGRIQHALSIASSSKIPTLILLEELDAYLNDKEKALILNVLDGSEVTLNPLGTLLIGTTNYPEAIDERVLKRPGRLDRIFIVPETRREQDAEQMLKQYLGAVWKDEHRSIVPKLLGYPGAFIREVAVYALTQMAYDDLEALPLEVLERSVSGLKAQIDARDDFLKQRSQMGFNHSGNRFTLEDEEDDTRPFRSRPRRP